MSNGHWSPDWMACNANINNKIHITYTQRRTRGQQTPGDNQLDWIQKILIMTTIRANGDGTMNFNTNVFCRSRHTHTPSEGTQNGNFERQQIMVSHFKSNAQRYAMNHGFISSSSLGSNWSSRWRKCFQLSSFSVCRRHCHHRLVITQCSFSTRRRTAFVTWHAHSLRLRASQSIWFLRKVQDIQPPPSHALFLRLAHFIRCWFHFGKTPCSVQQVIASNRARRRIDRWRTFIIKTYYSI